MGLVIQAVAAAGPWGEGVEELAAWLAAPESTEDRSPVLKNVVGFVKSPFINLTRHTQLACLAEHYPAAPQPARIGIVLASVLGDTASADKASASVAEGLTPQPLLFYQSIPVAIVGHLSIEFPLTGPLVCLSGGPELGGSALETAQLMIADGQVELVLLSYVEAGQGRWRSAAAGTLAELWGEPVLPGWDCSISILIGLADTGGKADTDMGIDIGVDIEAGTDTDDPPAGRRSVPRPLADFIRLALTARSRTSAGIGASHDESR
ncbi:MAG: hypothetical protein ACR2N4_03705 [Jatrophihabitans sp.]